MYKRTKHTYLYLLKINRRNTNYYNPQTYRHKNPEPYQIFKTKQTQFVIDKISLDKVTLYRVGSSERQLSKSHAIYKIISNKIRLQSSKKKKKKTNSLIQNKSKKPQKDKRSTTESRKHVCFHFPTTP